MSWLQNLFAPFGYTLTRADGTQHNRIRGDMIPNAAVVIEQDGHSFVRTGTRDRDGFAVYREGHRVHRYASPNS